MQSKARMTIRFEQPKPNQLTKPISQPLNQVDDDIQALEEIIRRSDLVDKQHHHQYQHQQQRQISKEILPPQREERYDEQWELDQPSELRNDWVHIPSSVNSNREGPSWGRVFLSVSAAVVTGALFGYMVLSLFTGEPLFPGKSSRSAAITDPTSIVEKDIPVTDSTVQPLASNTSEEAGGNTSVTQVAADVYYLLQYGVFKSEESMLKAVNELKDKGLTFATETVDDYRVYVGAAATKEDAELLAAQMSDVEVYIKPLEGEALIVPSLVLPEGAAEFMTATVALTGKLIRYSGNELQNKSPQVMGVKDIAVLEDAHRLWLTTVSATDKLSGRANEEGKAIIQALDSAMIAMNEYNRKPSHDQLWAVQSALMKAIIADRQLRSILQSSMNG